MNNTPLPGFCEGTPTFIKYMRNWCDNGMLNFGIIFYEANPDSQKNPALLE